MTRFAGLGFLLLVIEAGYFLLTPPFQSPDEFNHFYRSYQLAEGHLQGELINGHAGGEVPKALVSEAALFDTLPFRVQNKLHFSDLKQSFQNSARLDSETFHDRVFRDFPNTVLYSPVCYAPQIVAITTARILGLTVLESYYLARAFCFLFLAAIAAFSIWVLRRYGLIWPGYFAAFVTPMAIFQANSTSADVVTLGLALLFVTAVGVSSLDRTRLKWIRTALISAVLLALCKSVYFPIAFLAIPFVFQSQRLSVKGKWAYTAAFLILPLAIGTLWLKYVHPTYVPTTEGADPARSLVYLSSHLLRSGVLLFKTILHRSGLYFKSGVGILGWMDVNLPMMDYFFFMYVLFVFLFLGGSGRSSRFEKGGFLASVGLTILVIFLSVYLSSNAVGSNQLEGVFGRYFLPVLVVFGCSPFKFNLSKPNYARHLTLAGMLIVVVHFQAIWSIYKRFWTV